MHVLQHHEFGAFRRLYLTPAQVNDAGATLELGSDAPVAPLDPWVVLGALGQVTDRVRLGTMRPASAQCLLSLASEKTNPSRT